MPCNIYAGILFATHMSDDLTIVFAMSDRVTAVILMKGKEGRSDDLTTIFALGDHITTAAC